MRILVCGDRNWSKRGAIAREIGNLLSNTVIIHGACRGADKIAGEVARAWGLTVEEYPANWERYGRAAGPIRNTQMLLEGKPDLVWAFHECISTSKGTKNMVEQARKAGILVEVFIQ